MFYTYYKLQGSQTADNVLIQHTLFYTYYKLQGSQTTMLAQTVLTSFYTYYKLQGSQTSNGYHRTYIPGGTVIYNYFTIKHLSLSTINIFSLLKLSLSCDSSINNMIFLY